MAGIPLNWIVKVTSASVKDAFGLNKLHSVLVTKYNPALPVSKWSQYQSAQEVFKAFGRGTQSDFADNYFGFTSKLITQPDLLSVFVYNDAATPYSIVGGATKSLDELKKVNGKFSITINKKKQDITLDLSQANSYTDCASKLQDALRAVVAGGTDFTQAEASYNTHTRGFVLKAGAKGAAGDIGFPSAPTAGVDISGLLGLTERDGAHIVEGHAALANLGEVWGELAKENGAYYVITTDFKFQNEDADLLEFGEFIHASNNRFAGLYLSENAKLVTDGAFTEPLRALNGLMLEYKTDAKQAGLSAGIISAIDFSLENGNYNIAYNDATKFEATAIKTEGELNTLEANLANGILKFSEMGQSQTWFGMGNIFGALTNSANIYVANSYLSISLKFAVANMFAAQPMIGARGDNNTGIVRSYLDTAFSGAVRAGIIVAGAELTDNEKNTITGNFGKNAESAVSELSRSGYFYVIEKVDLANKTITIKDAYVANTPIKRVIINNYILGA